MTVFIVFFNGSHDIPEFVGVFSTREKAENCIKGFVEPPSAFAIEQHQVDER